MAGSPAGPVPAKSFDAFLLEMIENAVLETTVERRLRRPSLRYFGEPRFCRNCMRVASSDLRIYAAITRSTYRPRTRRQLGVTEVSVRRPAEWPASGETHVAGNSNPVPRWFGFSSDVRLTAARYAGVARRSFVLSCFRGDCFSVASPMLRVSVFAFVATPRLAGRWPSAYSIVR